MEPAATSSVVYSLPCHVRFSKNRLRRHLAKLQKKNRLKNYPLLACVPSDAIGQWIVLNGLYEEELLLGLFGKIFSHYLEHFKNQAILDVGANIGNHALFFSRYFKEVIAFEPNPTALKLLDTNIFLNQVKNIHVIPIGLSNESSTLPFVENLENLGGSRFHLEKTPIKTSKLLKVEIGDSILQKDFATATIGLIKLDIEGFELAALQGLKQTLIQHQPIVLFEAHHAKEETGSQAIFDYLNQLDYTYFYSLERKKIVPFSLISFLQRLVKGYEVMLRPMTQPEDRYYSLIIATTHPLM